MTTTRKLHRLAGLIMVLPFIAWAATGLIFFLKPGYQGAYEQLQVKTYPLGAPAIAFTPDPAWLEVRQLRTVLGQHLLVRTTTGWQHLDPATLKARPAPDSDGLKNLMHDAFTANPERYGQVATIDGSTATTTTGVRVSLSWTRLSLQQTGTDTDRIDRIYKIHYLQWTGVESIDRVVGMAGLALIVLLSVIGLRLAIRPSARSAGRSAG